MKKLLLIRHASAEDTFVKPDVEREISAEGLKEIEIVCNKFSKCDFVPDLIKVSSAKRTIQTADEIVSRLKWDKSKIITIESIYNSDTQILLNEIYNTSERINNLVIIAHNPTITEVVNFFNNSNFYKLAPCTFVYFEFEAENWELIEYPNLTKMSRYDSLG